MGKKKEEISLRILLAEDSLINQKVAMKILERIGYSADIAANGIEVLQALERQPYDVVLMDVQMPEMDGIEATIHIRSRLGSNQPRIIAMTASAMLEDRKKCLEAGMDDYVSKPIDLEELRRALELCVPQPEAHIPSLKPETASRADSRPGDPVQPESLDGAIDMGIIERLRLLEDDDDPNVVSDLIDLFLRDTPLRLTALREAAAGGDARALEQVAHSLKSSCGSLGALRMMAICADLEQKGNQGMIQNVEPILNTLEAEFGRVHKALESERK